MEHTQPNEEDSEEDEGDSDVEEAAITLAIIANTDVLYNDVADAWRIGVENDKRAINQRHDERRINHRIIIDELSRPTHEQCPGFNFSSADESTGRNITSTIGISTLSDFKQQQNQKRDVGEVVGKVTFYRDFDVEVNHVESILGTWVKQFHETLSLHCIRQPRYSELRPFKFQKFTRPF